MNVIPVILFWGALALVAYVYAGYGLVVWTLARLFPRPVRRKPVEPSVSLLIPAYNEAGAIEEKIRNSVALEYPAARLEIVVVSDGSTDGTADRAAALAGGRVRVLAHAVNRGKLAVLNETVPLLTGEIVVFSDATSMLEPQALRRLLEHFADPSVGAVSGVYRVRRKDRAALGAQEDVYWKYETFLKLQEAVIDSVLGCHGSLYAIRKELYPFPEAGTINDDYVIPVRIRRKGYRVTYEPGAVAYEEAREMGGFGRRVRIMAGNIEQMREIRGFLLPPQPLPLLFMLSHKVGRVLAPFCLLAAAAANLFVPAGGVYAIAGGAQAAFYGLAILGAIFPLRPRLLRMPYYFCMINAAALVAALYAATGRGRPAWKAKTKAARAGGGPGA